MASQLSRDYVIDAIVSITSKGGEVMSCWNGRRVLYHRQEGEIVGDYWEGTNVTGATRMVLVAVPSRADARSVHCTKLDEVEFLS